MARPPLAKLARRRLRVEEDDDNDNRPAQLAAAGLGAAGVTATGLALANYQRKARAAQRAQAAAAPAAPAASAPAAGGGRGRAVAGGLAGLAALLGLGGLGAHAYNKRNNVQVQHTGHAAAPAATPAAPVATPAPAAVTSHTPTIPGMASPLQGHAPSHTPTIPGMASPLQGHVSSGTLPGMGSPLQGHMSSGTLPGMGSPSQGYTPSGTLPGMGSPSGGRGLSDDTFSQLPTLVDTSRASLNPPGTVPARRPSASRAKTRAPLADTLPPAALPVTQRYPALDPLAGAPQETATRRLPNFDTEETGVGRTLRRPAPDPQETATRRLSNFDTDETRAGRTLRARQRVAIGPTEPRSGKPRLRGRQPSPELLARLEEINASIRARDAARPSSGQYIPGSTQTFLGPPQIPQGLSPMAPAAASRNNPFGYSPQYIAESEALGAQLRARDEARRAANGTRYEPGNETNPRISLAPVGSGPMRGTTYEPSQYDTNPQISGAPVGSGPMRGTIYEPSLYDTNPQISGAPVSSNAVGGTRFQASPYETQQLGRAIASAGPMGNREVTQPDIALAPSSGQYIPGTTQEFLGPPQIPQGLNPAFEKYRAEAEVLGAQLRAIEEARQLKGDTQQIPAADLLAAQRAYQGLPVKTGSLKTAAARRVYRVKVSSVRKVLSHYKLGNLKAADIDKLIRGNIMSVGGSDRQTPAEEASLADRLSRVFHAADSSGSPSASESSHGSLPMSGTATV